MQAHPFEAAVRSLPGVSIIDLSGEINSFADEMLAAAYDEAAQGNPAAIALNVHGVTYINSTGIALIVGLLARSRQIHIPLLIFGLSDHYREIFEITHLARFIDVFSDETSALASLPRVA